MFLAYKLQPEVISLSCSGRSKTSPPPHLSDTDKPLAAQVITYGYGDELLSTPEDMQMH